MAKEHKNTLIGMIQAISFEIFGVDESYNIPNLITNKEKKYDVSSILPNDFPSFCHQIRIVSGFQFYNKAIILWLGIGLLLGFFITIGSFVND